MSSRLSPSPELFPQSLRQDLLSRPAVSVLAFALVNTAVVTGAEAAPPATPAPVPPVKQPKREPGTTTPAQMPEVVVSGVSDGYQPLRVISPKYPEPLLDTPQSISVVTSEVMRDQNATNLRDVLRNVPGITIQAGEGGATPGDNFVIRGFSARTDLYVDGVRDVNGYTRDPFNIEQVEVVKGPASVYSGRGSTGGSINTVTKTPGAKAFYEIDGGVGTDEFYRATIDLNQPIRFGWNSHHPGKNVIEREADAALRLNALYQSGDVPGRDVADFARWGVAPSIAVGLNTPTKLTVSYMHFEQNNMPDFGLPWVTATNNALIAERNKPAPVPFSNYYGLNQRDHENLTNDEVIAILSHAFTDNVNLRYTFHYARNRRDSIISAPRFISNASSDINREFQSRDEVDTAMTNELDLVWGLNTWGLQHTFITGIEYTYETFQNFLRSNPMAPLADLYDPDVNDHFNGPNVRTGAVNEADTNTGGIYLFDTIDIGEHWQISGGVRGDYFEADYDIKDAAGNVTSFDHTDKMVSWRAALLYKPVPIGSIYFAYGTSFNPSAEGLVLSAATADLDPEKTSTFELGTKWNLLDQRLSLNAAVFYTLKENARTPGLSPSDPVTVLQGEQQVAGFEIEAKGHLTRNWQVIAGYSYLDTQIKESNVPAEVGNELPGVPAHTFNLWTTYDFGKLQAGAGVQYVGPRFANTINTREAESYCTLDAMLAYQVTKNVNVRLNVYNLTDETYISGLHIQGSYGHFIPGPSRSATLTVSLEF
jgi:catecholate siderophore receptor